jgi:ABC-type multidrug transport system fused ATPase/permease subunit
MNLKTLLKKLQKNYSNFKKLDKQEKAAIIIYSILSLIWNVFTLVVIIFIAKLNDTIIECLFILTSFWLTKRTFGKAFHLDSMIHCFIVSNASYYMLNRVTTPLGISIFVPILLGVGLSYVTSKFVKKQYKPLYKGMPEDLFEETILKVTDKDSTKYKVCYDFYIGKESDVSLSFKYNYSVAGIRKIKDRINEKIKGLN